MNKNKKKIIIDFDLVLSDPLEKDNNLYSDNLETFIDGYTFLSNSSQLSKITIKENNAKYGYSQYGSNHLNTLMYQFFLTLDYECLTPRKELINFNKFLKDLKKKKNLDIVLFSTHAFESKNLSGKIKFIEKYFPNSFDYLLFNNYSSTTGKQEFINSIKENTICIIDDNPGILKHFADTGIHLLSPKVEWEQHLQKINNVAIYSTEDQLFNLLNNITNNL